MKSVQFIFERNFHMINDRAVAPSGENPENSSSVFFLNPKLIASAAAAVRQRQENFQSLIERAEGNDLQAQHELALCYYIGNGTNQNYKSAAYWFTHAANMGHAVAQYHLGVCYENGLGVEQDDAKALGWYREAAQQEFPPAQCACGWFLELGKGVEQDKQQSEQFYRLSAEQGYAPAQCNLGYLYYRGIGVEENNEEAVRWFSAAAQQGNVRAMFLLGVCYENGFGVEKNTDKAVGFYEEAAQYSYPDAQYALGVCCELGKGVEQDTEKACEYYRSAAQNGQPAAQYRLGFFYYQGISVEENNEEAVRWFSAAAQQGHARAEYFLGECCRFGYGIKQDAEQAFIFYQKAADKGLLSAQYMLGVCHQHGIGTPQNKANAIEAYRIGANHGDSACQYGLGMLFCMGGDEEVRYAVSCFEQAAEQEHRLAQYELASFYWCGKCVKKDRQRALELYQRSAEQGYGLSMFALGEAYMEQQDYEQAVLWLEKSVEKREPKAYHRLGACYENGYGVQQDARRAAELFCAGSQMGYLGAKKALQRMAENGFAFAQLQMGIALYHGDTDEETEKQENAQAAMWFQRAAEQGEAEAQYRLGRLHYETGRAENSLQMAVQWFEKAAEQNHLDGLRNLAFCYAFGDGVKSSKSKSKELYLRAFPICLQRAEQGDSSAVALMAKSYWLGQGVKRDYALAASWFEKSAQFGDVEAMCRLGEFYERGQGVPKDIATASMWYRKAANKGSPYGLYKLAFFYEKGIGVEQNIEKSYKLYCRAANWGSGDAEEALGRRFGHKTRRQRQEESEQQDKGSHLLSDEEEYREYNRQLDRYNWDNGFAFPQSLLEDIGCDLALALKIFYLADGYSYLQRFLEQEQTGPKQWLEFVEDLYKKISERHFPDTETLFPGKVHSFAIPLSKVQCFRLRKSNVPAVFLENL